MEDEDAPRPLVSESASPVADSARPHEAATSASAIRFSAHEAETFVSLYLLGSSKIEIVVKEIKMKQKEKCQRSRAA